MKVIDFSARKTREPVKNLAALPNSIRMIIIGSSGSGKTQLLLNLTTRLMKWDKLYLVAPSVDDQRCYEVLKDFTEKVKSEIDEDIIEFITDIEESPSADVIDSSINNLVIYDDVMLDNQENLARIFSRGRHKNTDVIYVTQRYTQVPKVIRDNCNILAVFNGVDTHTLRNTHQTLCCDIDYNKFRNFSSHAQSTPHGFVTINLHDCRSRYRIGIDKIFG